MTDKVYTIDGLAMYAKIKDPEPARTYTDDSGREVVIDPQWSMDLLLNQNGKSVANKAGIRIRGGVSDPKPNPKYIEFVTQNNLLDKGYTGEYIKITKKAVKQDVNEDGSPKYKGKVPVKIPANPIKVRDSQGVEIPADAIPLIGNGSDVAVTVGPTQPVGKTFGAFGARFVALKIKELVEYKKPEQSEGSYKFDPDFAQTA